MHNDACNIYSYYKILEYSKQNITKGIVNKSNLSIRIIEWAASNDFMCRVARAQPNRGGERETRLRHRLYNITFVYTTLLYM